jgi:hypothetical protein
MNGVADAAGQRGGVSDGDRDDHRLDLCRPLADLTGRTRRRSGPAAAGRIPIRIAAPGRRRGGI